MRLWLYCLAALVFDWVLYVVTTVIPMRASDLGATPFQLANLQAASAVVYIAMSVVMGRVADRVSRPLLIRIGCLLMIVSCWLIAKAPTYGMLLAIMPLFGLTGTFFWPTLQGAIGAESSRERLAADIGLFNILWSIGKAGGFLAGGWLKTGVGLSTTLWGAAGGALLVILFFPLRDAPRSEKRVADEADPDLRSRFLRMSWAANFVAFGVGATLANQYISLCRGRSLQLGIGTDPVETFCGILLCGIFTAQTIVFAVLRNWKGWTYRRAPLYLSQLALAGGCALLAWAGDARIALVATPLLGVGIGTAYVSSIYYSLHTSEGHGKYSGLHEAILGSGGLLLPLGAGLLAEQLGDLRWPYWLCGMAALSAIVVEESVFRRRRSDQKPPNP